MATQYSMAPMNPYSSYPSAGNTVYQAYLQCVQMNNESVLQYSYRFQLLASRFGYPDYDPGVTQRYISGLLESISLQLVKRKPWEFASL